MDPRIDRKDQSRRRSKSQKRVQCCYEECLGAPVLLYRSVEDRYSILDDHHHRNSTAKLNAHELPPWMALPRVGRKRRHHHQAIGTMASSIKDEFQRWRRCQARWYYPMDYHVMMPSLPFLGALPVPGPLSTDGVQPINNSNEPNTDTVALTDQDVDWRFQKQHSFPLMQEARAQMLLSTIDGGSNADPATNEQDQFHREQILRAYQRFDRNWVLSNELSDLGRQLSQQYDHERMDLSDPSYMAPFPLKALEDACHEDPVEDPSKFHQALIPTHQIDPNAPHFYGNTLLVLPCSCRFCSNSDISPSWFLMHPSGPLLEQLTLSLLQFPRDECHPPTPASSSLDVDDTIRQLNQCGASTFVVRTSIHCVIVSLRFSSDNDEVCARRGDLALLHRMDRRFTTPHSPYYRPSWVTSHHRYGNSWTDSKVAIVLEDASRPCQRNTILHVHAGASSERSTSHTIANLQDINTIDFSTNHPMMLWSAARSFVRPALGRKHVGHYPPLGHGYSLYSIDLRTDQASFQWSPSGEEYEIEGTLSISGIYTDWSTEHSLFVASISAGKTWELDTRMPCRVVNSWSLPHACDDSGPLQPAVGLHGSGTIFSRPIRDPTVQYRSDAKPCPILSVSLNPGTFGIHIYQRPLCRPRFQTMPLECASCPGLAYLSDMSIAASSVVPLPEVSNTVFTCGLATISVPVHMFLDAEALARAGYQSNDVKSVMSVVSMTSQGDIYCHSMAESRAPYRRGKAHEGIPVGATAVAVDSNSPTSARGTSRDTSSKLGFLRITLSNQYPMPSTAVPPELSIYGSIPNLPPDRSVMEKSTGAGTLSVDPQASSRYFIDHGTTKDKAEAEAPPVTLDLSAHSEPSSMDARLGHNMNRFDHQSVRVAEKDEADRSDVTASLFAMASGAWPDLSESSSDDESS